VAKEAVARALGASDPPRASGPAPDRPLPRAEIEILAGPGGGPRSRILAPGEWPQVAVSLSHSAGVGCAVAAVARDADAMRLGCDIEEIAPRSEAFVSDYFTEDESAWIRAGGDAGSPVGDRHVRANLLWSAKESALKALGEGLRKDTRSVVVEVRGMDAESLGRAAAAWRPLRVASSAGERFAGWWRVADGLVWTVVG
jgi:4'-phosphopantetheinyl transferase